LNLSQEFAIAKIKFLDSRIHFSEILIGSAPGNNSPADSESFQAWLGSKLQKHVVCRVEGTDDVLFVDALLDQSSCVLRSNAAGIWNNFSYKHRVSDKQVELKRRVKTLPPQQLKQERMRELETVREPERQRTEDELKRQTRKEEECLLGSPVGRQY
jgi:hypothetical protein